MKSKINKIIVLSMIGIFFVACTSTKQSDSLTLRKVSVLNETEVYLPKRVIKIIK